MSTIIEVNDLRANKNVDLTRANVGDLVIDEDGDMYFIVEYYDEGYALLNLNDFSIGSVDELSVINMLKDFDDEWGIKEIVPASKLSITINN